ncbi:HAD-like protein [Gigaspora margarita]|uniref:HAD-like protein n=1 Tax=Gigaspora margarita TaxID=4874 RepID=A0A8H4EPZ2_GIGMA|nr:HAD-like protein [Gigaspora margarita]
MKITHCIFDMDGLLLDTERIYTEVTSGILAKFGQTYSWELKSRLMGLLQHDADALLINETGIDMTVEEYSKERDKGLLERFPTIMLKPGVMRLVKHLKAHNIPIAVATSSLRNSFEIKSTNLREFFSMFDGIVCGNDPEVKCGKPAPDIFLVASKEIGNPPVEQCLVFEDAINGIKAAKNAGMNVVWVAHKGLAEVCPGDNGADEKLLSLEDFNPEKYGLPPFDDSL